MYCQVYLVQDKCTARITLYKTNVLQGLPCTRQIILLSLPCKKRMYCQVKLVHDRCTARFPLYKTNILLSLHCTTRKYCYVYLVQDECTARQISPEGLQGTSQPSRSSQHVSYLQSINQSIK